MRPRRVIRTLAAATSLAAAVAVAALWVRSDTTIDWIERVRGPVVQHLSTAPGQLRYTRIAGPGRPGVATLKYITHRYGVPERDARGGSTTWNRPDVSWQWLGFDVKREAYAADPKIPGAMLRRSANALPGYDLVGVTVPMAFPIALLLAGPTWALIAWRRERRRGPTGCPACGYDLRATPDRCPECGTPARVVA